MDYLPHPLFNQNWTSHGRTKVTLGHYKYKLIQQNPAAAAA